jgi:hypothetical protein
MDKDKLEVVRTQINELYNADLTGAICYPLPPYVRWEPIKSSEGAIVAFTNRPCYRKGSHNHSICEERFVREHPRDARHPDYIKPQVN